MVYTNAAIFASEVISTCFAIYVGESIIANELLPATKGRAMGWGFVALGFGFAFGFGVFILGYISAHMNPAVSLALLILGRTDGVEFAAAVGGQFIGAFLAAILVWLHFLPHFKTVPTPPSLTAENILLRPADALSPSALGIASYNPGSEDMAARRRGFGDISRSLQDIKYYLKDSFREPVDRHAELVEVALGRDEAKDGADAALNRLRRRSVQVCDVHRRLKDVDIEEFKAMLVTPELHAALSSRNFGTARSGANNGAPNGNGTAGIAKSNSATDLSAQGTANNIEAPPAPTPAVPVAVEKRAEKLDKLYDAAVIADQNAKLSIFATRPAIYSPLLNCLTEFMGTTFLVFGALMVYARRDLLYGPEKALFRSQEGIWIGFFVFTAILGLGGPTGYAANPARDFSPRLAHFLLPIPGKGKSEWYYAWVPFVGSLLGGCAGAGLYALVQLLNSSKVDPTIVFPAMAG